MLRLVVLLSITTLQICVQAAPQETALEIALTSPELTVTVSERGTYRVERHSPPLVFKGSTHAWLDSLTELPLGSDQLGEFREVNLNYTVSGIARESSIRLYLKVPRVLFSTTYTNEADNSDPFPAFSAFPDGRYHFSFANSWKRQFGWAGWMYPTSPWLFFDQAGNSAVLSHASNFMIAASKVEAEVLGVGVNKAITKLEAGFTHKSLLVFGNGINSTFDDWGNTLTTLLDKKRVSSTDNLVLQKVGLWTDAGTPYWYWSDPSRGFFNTLRDAYQQYKEAGISLGYLELDSFWYPKGDDSDTSWKNVEAGVYTLTAHPRLFPTPPGWRNSSDENLLAHFQQRLTEVDGRIPLVVHTRWIDKDSPLRNPEVDDPEKSVSGDVVLSYKKWARIASYLSLGNVIAVEQDWLSARARSEMNLHDPRKSLANMAKAFAQSGMSVMYCMPQPEHYMVTLSPEFAPVTGVRVSNDRFDRDRWDEFLYNSRLAASVGLWPFADASRSRELMNVLLATLTAGPLGVSDELGRVNAANLNLAVRSDGVIVKPDAPILPLDQIYIDDADQYLSWLPPDQQRWGPMLASAYVEHNSGRTAYLFGYSRDNGRANQVVMFRPSKLGFTGSVYVYDFLEKSGAVWGADSDIPLDLPFSGRFIIVAPLGRPGIALFGDRGKFVGLSKQRVTGLSADEYGVTATLTFAGQEQEVVLIGYASSAPKIFASKGQAQLVDYDVESGLFRITVRPDAGEAVMTFSTRDRL